MDELRQLASDYDELSDLFKGMAEEASAMDSAALVKFPFTCAIKENRIRYGNCSSLTHGGMKQIDVVEDHLTGHPVAKATLLNESCPENIELFFREARIAAILEHPNIIPVYDIGFDSDDKPFFTMKLLTGDSLHKVIKELAAGNPEYLDRYDLNTRLNIFLKICDAISYAHSKGVIHLDLKPENIQLGEFGEVYVCDWGLAKILTLCDADEIKFDSGIYNMGTLHGEVKGTPGFMAPEQVKKSGNIKDVTTDVFSLGALLFAMLNLSAPFGGDDLDSILHSTLKADFVDWNKDLPTPMSLKAVCSKAMSLSRCNRYQSASELGREITAYLNGFATNAEEAGFLGLLKLLVKRNQKVCFVIFLTLVFMAFAVVEIKRNEIRATEALALFKQQQKETEQAYSMYDSQKKIADTVVDRLEATEAVNAKNLPEMLKLVKTNMGRRKFNSALKTLEMIERSFPGNEEAAHLYGLLFLNRFDYERATDGFRKSSKETSRKLYRICKELMKKQKQKVGKEQLMLKLLNEMEKEESLRKYLLNVISRLPKRSYNLQYVSVIQKAMEIVNPEQEVLNFKIVRNAGVCHVDLSGNKELQSLKPLDKLVFTSLDISHTSLTTFLRIVGSQNVSVLNISNTPIDDIEFIIKRFPNLQELICHKGQFSKRQLMKLPRETQVKYINSEKK